MKNAYQIVVFSFFLALAGVALIPRLNLQYLPTGDSQILQIHYSGYGLSAAELEREVCVPLESSIALMRGVRKIQSHTLDDRGSIRIEVDRFTDLEFFRFDLASKIRYLYPRFPKEVSYPVLQETAAAREFFTEQPVLVYSVSAPRSIRFLEEYAVETLAPGLARLEGVDRVRVSGTRERKLQIDLDADKLDGYRISADEVREQILRSFQQKAVGTWETPKKQVLNILVRGEYFSASAEIISDLRNLKIPVSPADFITLDQISEVYWKDQEVSSYYRINGQNALRILIYPRSSVNHITIADRAKKEIDVFRSSSVRQNILLTLENDQTAFLKKELNKIYQRAIWAVLLLLIFVVVFYMSWKPLLIIMSGILVNLGLAFILYYFLDIELHLYALAGITVTFGITIDSSIVMMHHIRTQRNRKVFTALLTATLTTISALLIIYYLPENLRMQLRYFGWVIVINLAVSLLVCLFFVPALMSLIQYDHGESKKYRVFSRWDRYYTSFLGFTQRKRGWLITALILLFGLPVFLLPTQWSGQSWYNKTIGSSWYRDHGRPLVNVLLGGTLRLFAYHVYEHAQVRDHEETLLFIRGTMPEGANLEQTNQLIHHLEEYLRQNLGPVRFFTTSIRNDTEAEISVYFDPEAEMIFPYYLKDRVQIFCDEIGGVDWVISGIGKGFSNIRGEAPPEFGLEFIGYDQDILLKYSEVLKEKLEQHPRISDIRTNTSLGWGRGGGHAYSMYLDLQEVRTAGLSTTDLQEMTRYFDLQDQTLILSSNSPVPGIDYSVRYPGADKWMLENMTVTYREKSYYPGRFMNFITEPVAPGIRKVNQEYVQGVKYEYSGSYRFGMEYLDEVLAEMKEILPLGFRMEKVEFDLFMMGEDTQNYLLIVFIIALIMVLSAIHFESLRWAFVVVTIIPLSYIGIFLIFYLTEANFDQGGYTSFVLVTGLSVNALIYLLSDYRQYLHRGMSPLLAYREAFQQKILPVFLTLLSTALGFLPFIIIGNEDPFWTSLAIGSIGGMMFSFLVIVFFTPIFLNLKNAE